jgi:tetratricopeptide (TPR) repeat protein
MRFNDSSEPIDLEALLPAAVRVALKHQSLDRFLDWAEESVPEFLAPELHANLTQSGAARQFARAFARNLWKGIPLPRNEYQPDRISETGRNDPCPCGSGRKYKHCCLELDREAGFNVGADAFWPFVLEELSAKEVSRLAELKRIPLGALVDHADTLAEKGEMDKAVRLLEPRLTAPWSSTGEQAEAAFDELCNLYDALERRDEKLALIDRVVAGAPKSRLRSAAWARLASIRADQGDFTASWDCFRRAQQDDSSNHSLGLLEVQLLLAQERGAEGRERARFWAARVERAGEEWHDLAALLREMSADPEAALARSSFKHLGPHAERLQAWAAPTAQRPLPEYSLDVDGADAAGDQGTRPERLAEVLRNMGVAEEHLSEAVGKLAADIRSLEKENPPASGETDGEDEPPAVESRDRAVLETPSRLRDLEQRWRAIFPLPKPISTQDSPGDDHDVWEPQTAERWIAFLEANAEAADSLSILDDLATAVRCLEPAGLPWFDDAIERPLLERSRAIFEQALASRPDVELPWFATQNRPALRSFARLYQVLATRDAAAALPVASRLLELNPGDNHGFRGIVVNELLAQGRDAEALKITEAYPGDGMLETSFGRALALFRLRQLEPATLALRSAIEKAPLVPKYLAADAIRQPKLDPLGVRPGGPDEAWHYREDARPLWIGTPGALEWLAQVARQVRPTRRRPKLR